MMFNINPTVKRVIISLLLKKKMTAIEILNKLCPPPEIAPGDVQDALAVMIHNGTIKMNKDRTLELNRD
jgi:hypothetical protein